MATLTPSQIYTLLLQGGFGPEEARLMTAIAQAESSRNPGAVGDVALQNSKWGPSVGLFQIRTLNSQTGTGGDRDIERLMESLTKPLNFEMAATEEMQAIALRHKPHAICVVPERREERTTEGGLNVAQDENRIAAFIAPLRDMGARVSLFIGADPRQVESAARVGAAVIEINTGTYCDAHHGGHEAERDAELSRIQAAAAQAASLGLEVHGGHGLTYETVAPIVAIPQMRELNIGHFLIGEAIMQGLAPAIAEMRRRMDAAREGI